MLFRRLAAFVAVLLAAWFAGCGSNPAVHSTKTLSPTQHCSPDDYAMGCALTPAGAKLTLSLSPVVAHGVDFAWGAPTVAGMRALGAQFGASYFSYDSSKGWTQRAGLVAEYHRAGIATVGVWETSANRASQGCTAGAADANEASRQARAVGNTTRPIDFAIDFDASGPQVASYFQCAHAYLGDRVGAYGGYRPLQYLCAHHLVGHQNWQTIAWSNGKWLPASCAPLEQWQNGSAVDYDRAIAKDYGQWPFSGGPTPAQRRAAKRASLASHKHERALLHGDIDRHHCRRGQHVTPRQPPSTRRHLHNVLCPRWIKRGRVIVGVEKRLEKELG